MPGKKEVTKKAEVKKTEAAPAKKAEVPKKAEAPKKVAAAKQPAKKVAKVEAGKKKVAAKPVVAAPAKKVEKKTKLNQHERIRLLIQRPAKSFRIGQDLPPYGVDVTRMVKWPQYIRMQRQKQILLARLKMPPPLNQFNHTLDKTTAVQLFKLLNKYRPEEKHQRRLRRLEAAKLIFKAKKADKAAGKRGSLRETLTALEQKKPLTVRCGINHVTSLVEKGKAQLVVIAHDVDPIEIVVWLPALCRKKHIPYCIVKSKSRLGRLVHTKTATCLALTNVRKEDRAEFDSIVEVAKSQYNDNAALHRMWSVPKFGIKHRQAVAKQQRHLAKAELVKTN